MIERPTERWRQEVREQAAALAAGTLSQDDAYAADLWPLDFVSAVDEALDRYEAEVRTLRSPSDSDVLAAVERVVTVLNTVDEEYEHIETSEREDLCQYIDDVLVAAGVDTAALAARHDMDRAELTDAWREW